MKKSKLLLSLAMMCLSIAVLCFGVFAAANVNYSISGNISYTITDVFAKINTSIYKVQGQTSAETLATNVTTLSQTALADVSSSTTTIYELHSSLDEFDSTSTTDNGKRENISLTLDSTYMTYYIVINIENLADVTVNATLTDSTTYTNLVTASNLTQSKIAQNEKNRNLVVAFSVDDKTTSTSVEMNYSVKVAMLGEFNLKNSAGTTTTTYYFREGMTRQEWFGSEYDTKEGVLSGYVSIICDYDDNLVIVDWKANYGFLKEFVEGVYKSITPSALIVDGKSYVIEMQGHTGGSK